MDTLFYKKYQKTLNDKHSFIFRNFKNSRKDLLSKIKDTEEKLNVEIPPELKALFLMDFEAYSVDCCNYSLMDLDSFRGNCALFVFDHVISIPIDYVKEVDTSPHWLPFADDAGGNYLAIDLDPGPKGRVGQVIQIGRDFDHITVLADNLSQLFKYDLMNVRSCLNAELPDYSPVHDSIIVSGRMNQTDGDKEKMHNWQHSLTDVWRQKIPSHILADGYASDWEHVYELSLAGAEIDTLVPISVFSNLRRLNLSGTKVTSLKELSSLPKLKQLFLGQLKLDNLEGIESCSSLQYVYFYNTPVDIRPLRKLKSLRRLRLESMQLDSLEPLAGLENLIELDISENNINSLDSLRNAKKLERLNVSSTNLVSLEAIAFFPALIDLDIAFLDIVDYSLISQFPNISSLSCTYKQFKKMKPFLNHKPHIGIKRKVGDDEEDLEEWRQYYDNLR